MMLALSGLMMGGMGTGMNYAPERRYNPPPRKLTPEEELAELDKRQAKFIAELEIHNVNRKANFPKFKEFIVYGLPIIASNLKNAYKNMNSLMRSNLIQIKEQSDVQVQNEG